MLLLLRHTFTRRILATLVFELVLLNVCFFFLVFFRELSWSQSLEHPVLTGLLALSSTLVVQFSLWSFGLYSRGMIYAGRRALRSLGGALVFSAVLLLPLYYLFSLTGFAVFGLTLKFYLIGLGAFMTLLTIERLLVLKLFDDSSYLGQVLILGSGPATCKVAHEARRHHGKTFSIAGVLSEDPEEVGHEVGGCKVLGTIDRIAEIVQAERIRAILISTPIYSPTLPVDFLLKCKLNGIRVMDSSDFYESLGKKVLLEKLDPVQFLLSENTLMTRFRWGLKTISEKLIALVLLVFAAPVMLATALLIKLTSPGPVLFHQERVGRDGKRINVIKFRSMVVDAERNGAVWATKNDPRTTTIGSFIRKVRIDELPQLFNVLRGDMAIVGPRPERPSFVDDLGEIIPFYHHRHLVSPGITGWAQVVYPYGASIEDASEKLRYDLYYIKNMSFTFDIMIILNTVKTVLFAHGGR